MAPRSALPVTTLTSEESQLSAHRADFMKRFFSVAVSVGFASKISEIGFLSTLQFPSTDQIHQIILLALAMCVVIGSWEFYFSSISKRPLVDRYRFYLDIIIVSLYILLLFAAKNVETFLFYFMLIMMSYVAWDTLSMLSYPTQYGINTFTLRNLAYVYAKGLRWWPGEDKVKATPLISIWWTIIFVGTFEYHFNYSINFYVAAGTNALIYVLYRVDQRNPFGTIRRLIFLGAICAIYTGSRLLGLG